MELVSWGDSNGFYLYMLQAFREIRDMMESSWMRTGRFAASTSYSFPFKGFGVGTAWFHDYCNLYLWWIIPSNSKAECAMGVLGS
ncbi:hypothetical protein POPTR_008G195401v4 [Populus trichocarpa]|uniref:Uncharacterized protein n=1 Tax=Populus trichocarpa TaxID=3694 RepID=A0ACC0SMX8_POPTR|nr:hypothetical protein POPTR_008G195401v4 [Populus trichocarpa]